MEHFLHAIEHAFMHSLIDSLKMIPILLVIYLIIAFFENKMNRWQAAAAKYRKLGPVAGALVGCVPQCGFSAAAASLYGKGFLTGGTLIAVFLSTSDEAIPVMLANRNGWKLIVPLILAKIIIAVTAGYILEYTVFRKDSFTEPPAPHDHSGHTHGNSCGCCNAKEHFRSPVLNLIWKAAVRTLQVTVFVMLTVFVIEVVMHLVGKEDLNRLLLNGSIFQPLLTALIGLIPGCAVSVLMTELFLGANISFGAAVAGLATGAGVGYIVLVKECHSPKKIMKILGWTYISAAASGMLITVFMR